MWLLYTRVRLTVVLVTHKLYLLQQTFTLFSSNSSAKEAEDNIRKAIEKGQILPKEERFDSNCITPGIALFCNNCYYCQT